MILNLDRATAFLSTQPILAAAITAADSQRVARNPFASDVLGKLARYGSISDRQAEALLTALQRASQPEETKVAAVAGKAQAIRGQVISVKWHDSPFHRHSGGYKMTVKVARAEGIYLLWGSVPSGLGADDLKGQQVAFVADVEPSDRDASFAFFKRPRKAVVESAKADPTMYGLASGRYDGLNPFAGGEEAA